MLCFNEYEGCQVFGVHSRILIFPGAIAAWERADPKRHTLIAASKSCAFHVVHLNANHIWIRNDVVPTVINPIIGPRSTVVYFLARGLFGPPLTLTT